MTQQKTKALNLRIPGPTPVPPDILAAVGRPMVNHRGKEFGGIVERISERLKDFFLTSQDVMVLSCSGTGGLEAAVVNTLSPGDKVLAVSIGAFGERFATIAETYAADVTMLPYEWGQPAGADDGFVAQRDQEYRLAAGFVGAGNETLSIRHFIGMRNARGVFGDAAVVGERRNRFSVPEARRAQAKPLGLEDGDTAFVEGLSRYSFQQCHGTGSIFSTPALKMRRGGAGHPSPPLRAH